MYYVSTQDISSVVNVFKHFHKNSFNETETCYGPSIDNEMIDKCFRVNVDLFEVIEAHGLLWLVKGMFNGCISFCRIESSVYFLSNLVFFFYRTSYQDILKS